MSIITIVLGSKKFNLSCPPEAQEQLIHLATLLEADIEKIQKESPTASFELALVIAALKLQSDKLTDWSKYGGKILEDVNKNFDDTMSDIYLQLKDIANKLNK